MFTGLFPRFWGAMNWRWNHPDNDAGTVKRLYARLGKNGMVHFCIVVSHVVALELVQQLWRDTVSWMRSGGAQADPKPTLLAKQASIADSRIVSAEEGTALGSRQASFAAGNFRGSMAMRAQGGSGMGVSILGGGRVGSGDPSMSRGATPGGGLGTSSASVRGGSALGFAAAAFASAETLPHTNPNASQLGSRRPIVLTDAQGNTVVRGGGSGVASGDASVRPDGSRVGPHPPRAAHSFAGIVSAAANNPNGSMRASALGMNRFGSVAYRQGSGDASNMGGSRTAKQGGRAAATFRLDGSVRGAPSLTASPVYIPSVAAAAVGTPVATAATARTSSGGAGGVPFGSPGVGGGENSAEQAKILAVLKKLSKVDGSNRGASVSASPAAGGGILGAMAALQARSPSGDASNRLARLSTRMGSAPVEGSQRPTPSSMRGASPSMIARGSTASPSQRMGSVARTGSSARGGALAGPLGLSFRASPTPVVARGPWSEVAAAATASATPTTPSAAKAASLSLMLEGQTPAASETTTASAAVTAQEVVTPKAAVVVPGKHWASPRDKVDKGGAAVVAYKDAHSAGGVASPPLRTPPPPAGSAGARNWNKVRDVVNGPQPPVRRATTGSAELMSTFNQMNNNNGLAPLQEHEHQHVTGKEAWARVRSRVYGPGGAAAFAAAVAAGPPKHAGWAGIRNRVNSPGGAAAFAVAVAAGPPVKAGWGGIRNRVNSPGGAAALASAEQQGAFSAFATPVAAKQRSASAGPPRTFLMDRQGSADTDPSLMGTYPLGLTPRQAPGDLADLQDGESEERIQMAYEDNLLRDRARRNRLLLAVGYVYLCWAVLTWICIYYCGLVRATWEDSQQRVLRDWGVGVLMEVLFQWNAVLRWVAFVLCAEKLLFRLKPGMSLRTWFERYVDHLSVQATLLSGGTAVARQAMRVTSYRRVKS